MRKNDILRTQRRNGLGSDDNTFSPSKTRLDAPETGRKGLRSSSRLKFRSLRQSTILQLTILTGVVNLLLLILGATFYLPKPNDFLADQSPDTMMRSEDFMGANILRHFHLPHGSSSSFNPSNLFGRSVQSYAETSLPLVFSSLHNQTDKFQMPRGHIRKQQYLNPDFGGLSINFYDGEDDVGRRLIARDLAGAQTHFRPSDEPLDDDVDIYYYFDDDELRGLATDYDETNQHNERKIHCRRVSDHYLHFPTCNPFHEIDRLAKETDIKYLDEGAFRQVFRIDNILPGKKEHLVIKDIAYDHHMHYDDHEYVRMDAIVAERLTASPRIYDIYGHCGLGIMSEFFFHRDIEKDAVYGEGDGYMDPEDLHDKKQVQPQNNFTGIEKLVLALDMSEALADLHGFSTSLIIHNDVQMSQFLFNYHKSRLKFNDFNRAEMPLFDEKKQQYCRYKNGRGPGNWRSPEEYKNEPLTEQIDIWSLGCNMYALLTGLNPLYDISSSTKHKENIKKGGKPFIDPRYRNRSPGEDLFADIIMKCFQYKPSDRPSIFQIVHLLRKAVRATLQPNMTKQKVMEGIKTLK